MARRVPRTQILRLAKQIIFSGERLPSVLVEKHGTLYLVRKIMPRELCKFVRRLVRNEKPDRVAVVITGRDQFPVVVIMDVEKGRVVREDAYFVKRDGRATRCDVVGGDLYLVKAAR